MADCALTEYVHTVIDAMTFTVEELFSPYLDEACVKLVLAKYRSRSEQCGELWPEEQLGQSVRTYLMQLRNARGS